jgi:S-DNA-T family DNA segregation ATPase FtsK/SpoIIIE
MAKRKSNIRQRAKGISDKSRVKPKRRSLLGRLFHFMVSPLVWLLIFLGAIAGLLLWQWSALTSWVASIRDSAQELFGWGLVLVALAVLIIVGMLWRRQLSALVHRWKLYQWNKWLSAVAFILAIWGTLALLNLGGRIGLAIIGQDIVDYPVWASLLRLLGLVLIGIILVAPGACSRFVASFFLWLGRQFRRQPAPRPTREELQAPIHAQTYTRPTTAEKITTTPLL